MKKIFVLIVGFMLLSTVSAFAVGTQDDTTFTVTGSGTNPDWSVSLSKSVQLAYNAGGSGIGFSARTYHTSGDKSYGSSSGDTKIYYINATNATLPDAPTTSTDTADFSSWTPM